MSNLICGETCIKSLAWRDNLDVWCPITICIEINDQNVYWEPQHIYLIWQDFSEDVTILTPMTSRISLIQSVSLVWSYTALLHCIASFLFTSLHTLIALHSVFVKPAGYFYRCAILSVSFTICYSYLCTCGLKCL